MLKKILLTGALSALVGAGAIAATTTPAAAYVVCNRFGDFWHATDRYAYPHRAGVVIHDDGWRWNGNRYHWHEHDGRGYWRSGVWINL